MEDAFIDFLKRKFNPLSASSLAKIEIGIGDDAAVLNRIDASLILTSDTIVDSVHFDSSKHTMSQIGRKVLAVNLSDIAAMGGRPTAFLLSLAASPDQSIDDCKQVVEGLADLATEYGVELVGGDFVTTPGPMTLTVSVLGDQPVQPSWRIDAAVADEWVLVSGDLGGSILGKQLHFTPRLDIVESIRGQYEVSAATDVSDGLIIDLAQICQASKVAAAIEFDRVPISAAATRLSKSSGRSPLEHALYDGEDFELILTVNAHEATRMLASKQLGGQLTRIGTITPGSGVWRLQDGSRTAIEVHGYRHESIKGSNRGLLEQSEQEKHGPASINK